MNTQLDPHEQLDCVVVTPEAWTVDNDILTPTMKVKRNRLEELFSKDYERWVGQKQKVIWL